MNRKIALIALVVLLAAMGFVIVNLMGREDSAKPVAESMQSEQPMVTGKITPEGEMTAEEALGQKHSDSPMDKPKEQQLPAMSEAPKDAAARMEAALSALSDLPPEKPAPQAERPLDSPAGTGAMADAMPEPKIQAAPPMEPMKPMAEAAPKPRPKPEPAMPMKAQPQAEPKPAPSKPMQTAPAKPAAAPAKAESMAANTVEGVGVEDAPGGIKVVVTARSPIGEYKYFTLKGPDRLVVDLLGDWKAPATTKVEGKGHVKQVRLGRHPEWIRLVLDLDAPGGERSYDFGKSGNTFAITVSK